MATVLNDLNDLRTRLAEMANAQFESDEYRLLFTPKLTMRRAQIYIVQRSHFVLNRRDCWGYVQAKAPFDVKKLIWDHEREELGGDPERGLADHYTLGVQEGEAVGLTPEDFIDTPPLDGVAACLYAWIHLARDRPWLEAVAASSALEISNSDEVIRGGATSHRMAEKKRDELGIPFERQHSDAEHMVADIEHAHLLMQVAEKYADDEDSRRQVLKGAEETWRIERVCKGAIAAAMDAAD